MEEFKIKEKIYDMIVYGNAALIQFPKTEKFILASDIRKSMYDLLKLAITVQKKYYKKTTLQELDVELDILRNLIRVAADKRLYQDKKPCLPFKKYEYWAKMVDEIGKMLGGYIKNTK